MILLLIVIVIIVEGNGFFWWNVIWLHSRERWIAFLWKLRDDWVFFSRNVTWTVIVSLPLKKIIQYASQNKTTCGNITVISLLSFQQVIEHLLSSFREMAIFVKREWPFYFSWKVI